MLATNAKIHNIPSRALGISLHGLLGARGGAVITAGQLERFSEIKIPAR